MLRLIDNSPKNPPRPRYRWPWFVLAGVLLGIALAILWVSHEVARTRSLRQWNQTPPDADTNRPQ